MFWTQVQFWLAKAVAELLIVAVGVLVIGGMYWLVTRDSRGIDQ